MGDADWRKEKRQRFGSIQVKKGKIYARVQYIEESTGKRKDRYLPAANRREARELLSSAQRSVAVEGQNSLTYEKATFNGVVEKYKSTHLVPATYQDGIKVTGKRSLLPTLSSLKPLVKHFGNEKIKAIKPSDVEEYKLLRLNTLVEVESSEKVFDDDGKLLRKVKIVKTRKRKIASVNRELELLRAIFNFAKGEDLLLKSPFDARMRIISSAAETHRDRVLTHEEEVRLLDECRGRRGHLRALIILAVDTGMRRGELFKLVWSDVDRANGSLVIRASNAKTEKSRTIGLTARARKELAVLWGESLQDQHCSVFGITSTVKNAWKAACTDAGISGLRFHDLRHTATTRLVRAGVPASEVMRLTGHTQTKTFLRYMNLTAESVANSANMLNEYLEKQQDSAIIETNYPN